MKMALQDTEPEHHKIITPKQPDIRKKKCKDVSIETCHMRKIINSILSIFASFQALFEDLRQCSSSNLFQWLH